jgi:hypothetical protein
VFGEVYGNTNRLKYGLPEGNRFAAFDIYQDGRFLDVADGLVLAYQLEFDSASRPSAVRLRPTSSRPALHNVSWQSRTRSTP